jgi:hypothetical protein
MSNDEARERIGQAAADVADAMHVISTYFALAISGHLRQYEPTTEKRWFHPFIEFFRKLGLRIAGHSTVSSPQTRLPPTEVRPLHASDDERLK